MKTKKILPLLLLLTGLPGFSTVWTVNNSTFSFTPALITINFGDTVNFVITIDHDAREVSQSTWNSNGNTALPGGFQTSFGGGMILPPQLGIGTHYYVCTPHADIGMKGRIIVQNSTAIIENQWQATLSVYPNPSRGKFQFTIEGSRPVKDHYVEIYNVHGERILQSGITNSKSEIDLSKQAGGIYFIKIYNGHAILTKKITIK